MAVAVISILVAKVKTLLTYCALVCSRNIMWHLLVLADKSPCLSQLLCLSQLYAFIQWDRISVCSSLTFGNIYEIYIATFIVLFHSQLSTEETAQLSKDIFIMKVPQTDVNIILSDKYNSC